MKQDFSALLFKPEEDCVRDLVAALEWDGARAQRVSARAGELIAAVRGAKRKSGGVESFFQTYSLSSKEGIALMCLAEALLRIPDNATAHALIRDKVAGTQWLAAQASSSDWMLRMAGLGLDVTRGTLEGPMARLGEPVIRAAIGQGMKILGQQFVVGQDVEDALKHAAKIAKETKALFSFDMLGEGARTMEDAQHYFDQYAQAIDEAGKSALRRNGERPGISVKLSALHPRYETAQEETCVPALIHRLSALARQAASFDLCLTVDAEEAARLDVSLKIIRAVMEDTSLKGWDGFGLAVQAYAKRTPALIDHLIAHARQTGRKIQIRLVKGAYWDSEIKRAQVKGLEDYPVYTRKIHTDLAYLLCAQKLLRARDAVYPMFATHNAHSISAVLDMAGSDKSGFEFQRLFGMGESVYEVLRLSRSDVPVRIYAPVGVHKDLLPYLVRRLLENGANSSFVNKVYDAAMPIDDLAADPVETVMGQGGTPHPSIPLPHDIFKPGRENSSGLDLDDEPSRLSLLAAMGRDFERRELFAASLVCGRLERGGTSWEIRNPAAHEELIGTAYAAGEDTILRAFTATRDAFPAWNKTDAQKRADILNAIADAYEANLPLLMSLCLHEAGKTLADAMAEVREAVDFCRYYAARGAEDFAGEGKVLKSYTGEENRLLLQGRGTFVCISPWNFPLAIFTGQVAAALMAGNCVIAKPAEQTPFVALAAVSLMHKAGVPENVLHLLVGDGRVGERIVQHEGVDGVAFTGSTQAAKAINRTLAAKDGAIVPLIAETGGQNAMIADSSALPEQLVDDVIAGAFGSAGQRCSATRVLYVQEDIADKVLAMLSGAMMQLRVGNPRYYHTDIGPVIDAEAFAGLQKHKTALEGFAKKIAEAPCPAPVRETGHYFPPITYEIHEIGELTEEHFGPILHVIRFQAGEMDKVVREINDSGYGLTFGIHSRIDHVAERLTGDIRAGNVYVNRSMIGAVVGVQPFGGNGFSGTGPKAGGPYYLHRFASEKAVSINTSAAGGNASLVMLAE